MERRQIPVNPCKDCEKRFIGCHAVCESYIAWQALNEELKEARRKERACYYETYPVRLCKNVVKK